MRGYEIGLAELAGRNDWSDGAVGVRAPEHVAVPLGEDESITCVQLGLWLVAGDEPLAIMLARSDRGMGERLALEVMAGDEGRAEAVVAELWRLMNERNVYRGRVLELRARHFHGDEAAPLTVRSLPPIAREQIVLPEGVLERIERTTFGMSRHAERLRASGRHMRRGLLLHGPPGVGKTLTAMYLATQMPERTVVLLTGQGLGTVTTSGDRAGAVDRDPRGRRPRRDGALVRADERDPLRAAQRDGRPRRRSRRPVRPHDERAAADRAGARRAAGPDRPGGRAAPARRGRSAAAARALRRGAGARPRSSGRRRRGRRHRARGDEPRVHPRAPAAGRSSRPRSPPTGSCA
jgi:hypothetical protein